MDGRGAGGVVVRDRGMRSEESLATEKGHRGVIGGEEEGPCSGVVGRVKLG